MSHDPALDAHEQHEHAEHAAHERDPFISRVSITVALLAVLAAVVTSLETVESGRAITTSSESVLAQDKATDAWNEYQADSLKRHMLEIAADQGGSSAARYDKQSADQAVKQKAVKQQALRDEAERDRLVNESAEHEQKEHWLTGAATMLEIGIAMSTVTIITRRRPLWLAALGFGAVGLALLALGYAA
jgi:hypothetical protein